MGSQVLSVQDRVNSLFEKLVPGYGKCDTVAGEIIRAVCRIGYRFFNDGDNIGIGYGNETCNCAARYLCDNTNSSVKNYIFDELWGKEYDEDEIDSLCKLVLDYLDANQELMNTLNTKDIFDYYDKQEDESYIYEEEDEDEEYYW